MEKIDYDTLALQVIGDSKVIKQSYDGLVVSVEGLNKSILKIVKESTGALPDEESFLKLIATIIAKVYKPEGGIMQNIVYSAVLIVLRLADKLIDKMCGANWFEALKSKI